MSVFSRSASGKADSKEMSASGGYCWKSRKSRSSAGLKDRQAQPRPFYYLPDCRLSCQRADEGKASPHLCRERLGWRWAGVPPRRCCSGLSAVSLGYRRRDELSASGAARACAMGGAPVRECGGVDVNTQHDVSSRPWAPAPFPRPASATLSSSVASCRHRRRFSATSDNLPPDPIGPNRGRRFILEIVHRCSPCRCCLSLTRSRRVARLELS